MGLGEIMIVVHGFVWLMLQGKSEVQQEKESKRGDPTGPSPHVRVTQGCTHGTKGNTSKILAGNIWHEKERLAAF